ncbi:MAG: 1-acyl-sn-glycerol-3-phosphate acyltransferase [Chitinivibrionales bacterium]|nr:1-acyl-sn-glycerol-3-phosphate acyltransferase [Chitinivibrionales bacterium]
MKQSADHYRDATASVDDFLQKTFTAIEFKGPAFPFEKIKTTPTMFVSSHRSHLDYLLLGILLLRAGVTNLRFAAGDNLTNMPILGKRLRSFGAFSVYRSKRMRRNYIVDLCEKVTSMVASGEKVVVFPEGGRSYSGALAHLQNGVLAANVIAQHRFPHQKFIYLPMTVVYEQVPELPIFNLLKKGKELRSSGSSFVRSVVSPLLYFGPDMFAFLKLYCAVRLGRKFGRVFIDYGEPFAVSDYVAPTAGALQDDDRISFTQHKNAIQLVSNQLRDRLYRLYRILPMHLLAHIFGKAHSMTKSEALSRMEPVMAAVQQSGRNCINIADQSPAALLDAAVRQLSTIDAIRIKSGTIMVTQPDIIAYYGATLDQKL